MSRKPGNPNWSRPASMGTLAVSPPTFESVAGALGLAPKEFKGSIPLKEWVNRNKDHKYVPLDLLEAWGFL
jgi:hypothetical protein